MLTARPTWVVCALLALYLGGTRASSLRGVVVVVSQTSIDDSGGAQRATQLSLELLRQGLGVVFVQLIARGEHAKVHIPISHPNLFVVGVAQLGLMLGTHTLGKDGLVQDMARVTGSRLPLALLVEIPHAKVLPLVRAMRGADPNVRIIYDLIDEWNGELGWWGYQASVEGDILAASSTLVATVPQLAARMVDAVKARSPKGDTAAVPVTLLPNAYNPQLFDPLQDRTRPTDLPESDFIVLYTGTLWGSWFNWDLLVHCATQLPEALFVLVGDYNNECPQCPANVLFCGLKPHREMASYLRYAHVTIIPWNFDAIAQVTSPLKVYEYISMRVPVVVPSLPALHGMPLVHAFRAGPDHAVQDSLAECVDMLRRARTQRGHILAALYDDSGAGRDHATGMRLSSAAAEFLSNHTWTARVRELFPANTNADAGAGEGSATPGVNAAAWRSVFRRHQARVKGLFASSKLHTLFPECGAKIAFYCQQGWVDDAARRCGNQLDLGYLQNMVHAENTEHCSCPSALDYAWTAEDQRRSLQLRWRRRLAIGGGIALAALLLAAGVFYQWCVLCGSVDHRPRYRAANRPARPIQRKAE